MKASVAIGLAWLVAAAAGCGAQGSVAPAAEAPPAAEASEGRDVFASTCRKCHGPDGAGDTKMGARENIPSLRGSSRSAADVASIVRDGVAGTKMKAFAGKLSAAEIEAVATFVSGL